MASKLFLMGGGGHAKMVIEAARSAGYQVECCLAAEAVPSAILGVPVEQESAERIVELARLGAEGIVALGNNKVRAKLQRWIQSLGVNVATIVASSAYLSPSATLGMGVVVMPRAAIGAEARIGDGAIINTCASVDHDCRVGEFAHIAPGTHLAGNVSVGDRTFLGVGVSVVPWCNLGDDCVVGAGAVVLRDVPNQETWVGVPAGLMRRSDKPASAFSISPNDQARH